LGLGKIRVLSTKTTGSFCAHRGTPLLHDKERAPHAVNIPRALFDGRTSREPRYHPNFAERQDWPLAREQLLSLKGHPRR
jgi:hypothetical protein